jgi:hypothetical protein
MQPPSPDEIVRYVIVVHGIGQQKKNETVQPVIQRFAQARNQQAQGKAFRKRQMGDPITLGLLASNLKEPSVDDDGDAPEEGWIEFERIPQRPPKSPTTGDTRFIGRRTGRGENLRFVDLNWSNVTDKQFPHFGEPVGDWTKSLIDRLHIRGDVPPRILALFHVMRAGVIPLHDILSKRDPELTKTVFNQFLGDVQLYGEYLGTRGAAVRRFHERFAQLEEDHYKAELKRPGPARRPRYTVIAHSLGSMMSFDALVFAHMKWRGSLDADRAEILKRLPEYDRNPSATGDDTRFPDLEWIRNVDTFVTLGSPIDKFLVLWWFNYDHLVLKTDEWVDKPLLDDKKKIRHYNYCDEQDPVGDKLDVAYSTGALAERIFHREEDVVYTRYSVPGVAHVGYWTDDDLLRRILDQAVDGPDEEVTPVAWFSRWSYLKALAWSYVAVPFLGWLAASAVMIWAFLGAGSWMTRPVWALLSFSVLLFTCWLMRLVMEWRWAVTEKGRIPPADRALDHAGAERHTRHGDPLTSSQRNFRKVSTGVLYTSAVIGPVVWLYLLVAAVAALPQSSLAHPEGCTSPVPVYPPLVCDDLAPYTATLSMKAEQLQESIDARVPTRVLVPSFWSGMLGGRLEANAKWAAAGVDWRVSSLIASSFAFLIALWNLLIFLKIWLSRDRPQPLDFVEYVNNDPTRTGIRTAEVR